MAIPEPEDPFLIAQAEILSALKQTQSLHASYNRIRSLGSSTNSPELIQARQELQDALDDLAADLQDLTDSVKAVEGDPFRFGLDVEEVGRRRQLVISTGHEAERLREGLQSSLMKKGKGSITASGAGLPSPSEFDDYGPGHGGSEDDYGAYEQQRQVEMMHDQEEQLDDVYKTVGNLRAQADTMGRELEDQAGMLNDVDNVADRVGGKLQNGIKKVGWVIKNNEDSWSSCCIGILILVLVLLLILVIAI